MLADVMLPEASRYDERARAVWIRIGLAIESLAPLRWAAPADGADGTAVDPNIARGLR